MNTFLAFWYLFIIYILITATIAYAIKFYHYAVLTFRLLYNRNRIVITLITEHEWKISYSHQFPTLPTVFKCQIHLKNNKSLVWVIDQHGKCIDYEPNIPVSKRLRLVRNISHPNDLPHYFPVRSWHVFGMTRWLLNKLIEEPFVIAKLSCM